MASLSEESERTPSNFQQGKAIFQMPRSLLLAATLPFESKEEEKKVTGPRPIKPTAFRAAICRCLALLLHAVSVLLLVGWLGESTTYYADDTAAST